MGPIFNIGQLSWDPAFGISMRHIDLSHLEHVFKGNRSRVEEWIRLYLTEAPQYFHQMQEGLAAGNAEAVAAAAHDLQPQAHYLGVAPMVQLLVSIEEIASTAGATACGHQISQVLAVAAEVDVELRKVIGLGHEGSGVNT